MSGGGSTGRRRGGPPGPREAVDRSPFLAWLPVMGWGMFILGLSAQSDLPAPPGPLAAIPGHDKLEHLAEYAIFGLLLGVALPHSLNEFVRQRGWLFALVIGAAYGVVDESFQRLVPGRDSDVVDALVDTAGVALAQVALAFRGAGRPGLPPGPPRRRQRPPRRLR